MTDSTIRAASERVYKLWQAADKQYKATRNKHGTPSREEQRVFYLCLSLQQAYEHLEQAVRMTQEIDQEASK